MRDEATVAPALPDDWAAQAADSIEQVVTTLRDRTAAPLTMVVRTLVYGLLAAIVGVAGLVLLAIGAVRALDVYLPEDVWAAHLVTGGIFTLAGLFLWAKRAARS
jgi:hypothetical protein